MEGVLVATATFLLYKKRRGQRHRDFIGTTRVVESVPRVNSAWVRSLIRRFFPEFVIPGGLILLSAGNTTYTAMRACRPEPPEFFAWQYLEIIAKDGETDGRSKR